MNKLIRKSTGIVFGLTLALLSGAPAIADDTELLLVTPPDPSQLKPNVMFILDTSGSMTTVQETGEPYNPLTDYSAFGDCDINNMYYSEDGSVPVCDGANTRYVDKGSWNCNASSIQIADVGAYTGVLAQYSGFDSDADGTDDDKAWQPLEPGNSSDDVECQADSGVHGSINGNALVDVYPVSGADPDGDGWTSDELQELAWGSSGANITYSIYDGNYLNYKKDPATRDFSRSDIMKEVIKTVLNSVNDMNVGLMRFNQEQGGTIIRAPSDLDTNRADILAEIDALPAAGYTPLGETLFETALFWQGLPKNFGESSTAAGALVPTDSDTYQRPDMLSCSKNFNVLVSDGNPVRDVDTPGLIDQLPGYSAVLDGRTDCTRTNEGACMEDVAEYLANVDINPALPGRQSVTTHTIGFTQQIDTLEDTAEVGGGQYIQANDTDELLTALTDVVSQVNERALSFTAPAVSVNTFNRTRNLNNVYLTMFGARGNAHWPGNLKAYRIESGKIVDALGNDAVDPGTGFFYNSARSYWTLGQADGNDVLLGGSANQLPDPGVRRLFTDNGFDDTLSNAGNAISIDNIQAYSDADFGLTGNGADLDGIIRWMRGEDIDDGDPLVVTKRNAMGDPLHSRPAAVVYGGTPQSPEVVVYTATNDGYLHAVDASTGEELWSYVPKDLLPNMSRLYEDPEMSYKLYGIDGDIVPVLRDVDRDGQIEPLDGDFALILFGMRRGGDEYRMLNVTDKNNPVLVWTKTLDYGGQSWSAPVVTRMDIADSGQNALKAVVVLGGGYDGVNDTPAFNPNPDARGAGVHVLDLLSGTTLWYAGHSSTEADLKLDDMTRAIPTRVKVIDINGDSFADRMYAADMGGQVWRFDILNTKPRAELVAGGVLAQLGAEGLNNPKAEDTRRFYNSPDVAVFNDASQNRRFISVSIGSGYRAHPLDLSATDRFYSIRDSNVFNSLDKDDYINLEPIVESDLEPVSGKVDVTITADKKGWMLTLPDDQMILADSVTFNGEVFFVSFTPNNAGAAACNVGQGTNFLWRVSILNGDPIVDNLADIPTDGEDAARQTQLAQGGIAPTPQFLFPSPDDPDCTGADCNPPPIGCIGVECFDPGFQNNPVRTLWTQDGIE